jgi:hypothetical protein
MKCVDQQLHSRRTIWLRRRVRMSSHRWVKTCIFRSKRLKQKMTPIGGVRKSMTWILRYFKIKTSISQSRSKELILNRNKNLIINCLSNRKATLSLKRKKRHQKRRKLENFQSHLKSRLYLKELWLSHLQTHNKLTTKSLIRRAS